MLLRRRKFLGRNIILRRSSGRQIQSDRPIGIVLDENGDQGEARKRTVEEEEGGYSRQY